MENYTFKFFMKCSKRNTACVIMTFNIFDIKYQKKMNTLMFCRYAMWKNNLKKLGKWKKELFMLFGTDSIKCHKIVS
jgi:hypothetical protein